MFNTIHYKLFALFTICNYSVLLFLRSRRFSKHLAPCFKTEILHLFILTECVPRSQPSAYLSSDRLNNENSETPD